MIVPSRRRRVLLALVALAVFLVAMALIAVDSLVRADDPALGTRASCAVYDGLPAGFGRDALAGMVRLEGGRFVAGSSQGYAEERPGAEVTLAPFWIDRTEVTNAQFEAFVKATGYVTEAERAGAAPVFRIPSEEALRTRAYAWWQHERGASFRHPEGAESDLRGRAQQPVVQVTLGDALAYARWLGRRLPTEQEWELAARAGRTDEGLHRAPRSADGRPSANFWQGTFPTDNTREDGFVTLAPVGCFAPNAFGLYDTLGNVWEWTSSVYVPHAAPAPRVADDAPVQRVIKGGSFLCAPDFCARYRVSARHAQEPDVPSMHLGFRTARDG